MITAYLTFIIGQEEIDFDEPDEYGNGGGAFFTGRTIPCKPKFSALFLEKSEMYDYCSFLSGSSLVPKVIEIETDRIEQLPTIIAEVKQQIEQSRIGE